MKSKLLNNLSELGKVRIVFFVALSTSVGYVLAKGSAAWDMIYPVLGVFLLSYGSSAINEIQEWRKDALMKRTMNRPVPSGSMSLLSALIIAFATVISGSFILYYFVGLQAFILGLAALIWYNAIYTPLKTVTSLAVVPGAVVGALPPVIGWVGGGGHFLDPQALSLSLFFFIWQVPHFWLLMLIFEDDYRNAGFPVLTDKFSKSQITRMTYAWIIALVVSCLLIPSLSTVSSGLITDGILLLSGIWLIYRTRLLWKQYQPDNNYRAAFMQVNFYVLGVSILLAFDKLF